MAIVKMKRLRLAAMQADREDLMRLLQRMGCVEIDEPAEDLQGEDWQQLSRPDAGALNEAREEKTAAEQALSALKKYAPEKTSFLAPRRQLSEAQLFDPAVQAAARSAVRAVREGQRQLATLEAETAKLENQLAQLAPWRGLDVPLDMPSTRDVAVELGTLSAATPFEEIEGAVLAESPLAELKLSSSDRNLHYVLLLCHKGVQEQVREVLKEYGWSRAGLTGLTGTAEENCGRIQRRLTAIQEEMEAARASITAQAPHRAAITCLADRAGADINREEAKSRLVDTRLTFFLKGWVPAERWAELEKQLAQYGCACQVEDPAPEDYPKVPVKLKNNWFTRPLNMVTEMYSLPAYNGLDPNPLMAPFFILFYGIMMADMGYGLLMMLASVVVLTKKKPKGGMNHFFSLLGLCGVSTFLMGAVTGGFFGDLIPQLLKIINPESTFVWFWPPLFTPLEDTLMILVGAMALGFVQILTGMAISFVKKLRDGQVMDAVWEELTWWVVFAGLALAILGVTNLVLILGGVMVLVGSGWHAKGFGKVTAVFASLYNHVTGYFGDILSYARLMALMLAGSVIAQVFNTLGAIPGNIFIFLIISAAGNALNFALNLLGCYVHDLRLQCLEYFGKFYVDGGRPFRPVEFNTKYVEIKE